MWIERVPAWFCVKTTRRPSGDVARIGRARSAGSRDAACGLPSGVPNGLFAPGAMRSSSPKRKTFS